MIRAPAMSGPRLMPNSPRIMKIATVQIANEATLRSTVDSASTCCVERTLIFPVSVSSPPGASVAFVHLRPARDRPARGTRPTAGAPHGQGCAE